jgi:antitoxin component YwqK of YwqJK toxin-antitoxin module
LNEQKEQKLKQKTSKKRSTYFSIIHMRTKFTFLLLLIVKITLGQSLLEDFKIKCGDNFDSEKYQFIERIIDTTFENGSLTVILETYDNCANVNSKGHFKIQDDTIKLYYEQIPEIRIENGDTVKYYFEEMCDCPILIDYKISNIRSRNYKFKLNNNTINYHSDRFVMFPVSFEIVNGDTINYADRYGLKQGVWIESDTLEKSNVNIFYVDSEWKDGIVKYFHENGNIRRIIRRENYNLVEFSEYDLNGNLIEDKVKNLLFKEE